MKKIAHCLAAAALVGAAAQAAAAGTYDLAINETTVDFTGLARPALAINGTIPGPTLRFSEGEEVIINVTNNLAVDTSLHWHGFILPPAMDGVPGISFDGIKPGQTFTYRFKIRQNGTYWYHSHSGLQEQAGLYGAIVITPRGKDPVKADRDYVVMLSDWTDEAPETVLAKLKKQSDYYNYNQRTVGDFFQDVSKMGWAAAFADRRMWGEMRMEPTDLSDVGGYTYLVNGHTPKQNWTALFKPNETIRLRFINGSAMSYYDIRIPGLKMQVVAADGQNVRPVAVDRLRISVAETYDVIVRPTEDRAYTLFAEAADRSGYARATLATKDGMTAPIPALSERPLLTMADMAGDRHGMGGKAMAATEMAGAGPASMKPHASMKPMGQDDTRGPRVLQYRDLKALVAYPKKAPPRELVIRLTGNMERYFWSINGQKYSEAEPIRLRHNERLTVKLVNETMMNHPMHLHGHWMEINNGAGPFGPRKHVINVKPGETVTFDLTADAIGQWAFHCHLLYHIATGMFRKVIVEPAPSSSRAREAPAHG